MSKDNHLRLDIQGLRGVAILSVILFHFFPKLFPLGYLGVDLFFVISGFLITSIILKKLKDKEFSFKLFFIKRFYRIIIPVLFVLVFFGIVSFFIILTKKIHTDPTRISICCFR
jgi:peptidoglycan/LPS O-acetylase OafA/YrhL